MVLRVALYLLLVFSAPIASAAHNPIIWADVPDVSTIRVGDTYYMSSTTMHMSPGVPILYSHDLVNWQIAGYAYNRLVENDQMNLLNGEDAYGKGSWASSLRYHNGRFYVSTFSATSGKTHIYSTDDVSKDDWKAHSFKPVLHDNSLFFDDDGRVYMIYGGGQIKLIELNDDASAVKPGGVDEVIIDNANLVFGEDEVGGLPAEGSQMFKINGMYYLFTIASPKSHWSRTVIVHRAKNITGPYESRIALQDRHIAQGGLVETAEGEWYATLFGDRGAVGRIPYLVPVKWQEGWPVLGVDGRVPDTLPLPSNENGIFGLVSSDEFERKQGDAQLPLVWQWNHNPDNNHWSLLSNPGRLRITTSRVDEDVLHARNTLTQRTFGPVSIASTHIDVANMKDGDVAGLIALQKQYGFIGVKMENGKKSVMVAQAPSNNTMPLENTAAATHAQASDSLNILQSIPLNHENVFLRIDCDFKNDRAYFYYRFPDNDWVRLGPSLQMKYTFPKHFMGYRFGLFNYATESAGGSVDFHYYRVGKEVSDLRPDIVQN